MKKLFKFKVITVIAAMVLTLLLIFGACRPTINNYTSGGPVYNNDGR
jgi:hypothetical protein